MSDELYSYVDRQNQQIIKHIDNTGHVLANRIQCLSDDIYEYVNRQMCSKNENLNQANELEKLRLKLWHMGYEYDRIFSRMELDRIERKVPGNRKKIEQLKGEYDGKRFFIVGNGPSLRSDDLELIRNEISFACNRIGEIYQDTEWRPEFYFCSDTIAFANRISKFVLSEKNIIVPVDFYPYLDFYENVMFYPLFRRYSIVPEFSDNVLNGAYDAGTVLYITAQFAVYMGFKEIILLGVDAVYPMVELEDGRKVFDTQKEGFHFYQDNQDDKEAVKNLSSWMNYNDPMHSDIYDLLEGWKMLDYQSRQLGFQVINATRGGKLEIFERKDLKDVLAVSCNR